MKDTVVICGSHPRGREKMDWERRDADIIVFNEALSQGWAKRAEYVFQMHKKEIWLNPKNRNDHGHCEWLKRTDIPTIVMQEHYEEVPNSVPFPFDEIQTIVKSSRPYFTSSIAYAVAWAMLQQYQRIEITGVEMETGTEYIYQRDGVNYWVGIAVGRGIDVVFDPNYMREAVLYGYEGEVILEYDTFVKRVAVLAPMCEQARINYDNQRAVANKLLMEFYHSNGNHRTAVGVIQENLENSAATYTAGTPIDHSANRKIADKILNINAPAKAKAFQEALKGQIHCGFEFGKVDGARQENERYRGKADTMKEASGGQFLFSRQEFEHSAQALTQQRENIQAQTNTWGGMAQGAFGELEKANSKFNRKKRLDKFTELVAKYIEGSIRTGLIVGAMSENMRYLKELDMLIRAAGGSKSEAVMLEALAAGGS